MIKMNRIVKTKIDVEIYKKELKEKIKNSDITEQDIENHLMTIKYLKHLRNNMLVNAVESLFVFLILYMILKGLPLLIAFCATIIIVFSIISEFRFYYKNIQYFYQLNDQMNNIVNNNIKE